MTKRLKNRVDRIAPPKPVAANVGQPTNHDGSIWNDDDERRFNQLTSREMTPYIVALTAAEKAELAILRERKAEHDDAWIRMHALVRRRDLKEKLSRAELRELATLKKRFPEGPNRIGFLLAAMRRAGIEWDSHRREWANDNKLTPDEWAEIERLGDKFEKKYEKGKRGFVAGVASITVALRDSREITPS